MAAQPSPWLDEIFASAKEKFKQRLDDPKVYDEISKMTSIDDIYNESHALQDAQERSKTLRALKRIQPFLDALKDYSGVVEVFVQARPDILSLIWGPLKFLLRAADSLGSLLENVVAVMQEVGMSLSNFQTYAQLFKHDERIRHALVLFYEDILEFYTVLLRFSTKHKVRNRVKEALWPYVRFKIKRIRESIASHKEKMTENVTYQVITQAQEDREIRLEKEEYDQNILDSREFSTARSELNPVSYDLRLADILRRSSVTSGAWLDNEPDFLKWVDPTDKNVRIAWLHGIPGSGKTFLTGNLIRKLQRPRQNVLFAFLAHDNRENGYTIKVLHTFLFQLLEGNPMFRPVLHEPRKSEFRQLQSDVDFIKNLLLDVLKSLGPTYIILDGIDELDEISWKNLLSTVLQLQEACPETKLLISSREERDIALKLKRKSVSIRIDHKNHDDIDAFVRLQGEDIVEKLRDYGADDDYCLKTRGALKVIVNKAKGKFKMIKRMAYNANNTAGMFLYARLVLEMVNDQGTLSDIERELENLPEGLDEAYGRLLHRIQRGVSPGLRVVARNILQWIACAHRPLREEEMLQILAIEPKQADFTKGRKEFRDICKTCGPIIEVEDDTVGFVHFTAKEYLLHEQSNSFLNLAEAHFNAASVCATYLSFASLDVAFPPLFGSLRDETLKGTFVLLEYASTGFVRHINQLCTKNQVSNYYDDLTNVLTKLFERRERYCIKVEKIPTIYIPTYSAFEDDLNLKISLMSVACYMDRAQLGVQDKDDPSDARVGDPLSATVALEEFRRSLEDMICQEQQRGPNSDYAKLTRLYGPRIYHCDQQFCPAYRKGFNKSKDRDQHLKSHQRPYKCSELHCMFGETGFRSRMELKRHKSQAHPSQHPGDNSLESVVSTLSALTLGSEFCEVYILEDFMMKGRTDLVKQWFTENRNRYSGDIVGAFEFAAWKAPSDSLACLIYQDYEYKPRTEELLAIALEAKNLPNIKLLLLEGADMRIGCHVPPGDKARSYLGKKLYMPRDVYTGYERALSLWDPSLITYLDDECNVRMPPDLERVEGVLFANPAVQKGSYEQASERFDEFKKWIQWPISYTVGLRFAIEAGNFISAKVCLQNGADTEEISELLEITLKAIGKKPAPKYIKCVKLLVQLGATNPKSWGGPIDKGVNHMEKLFGCSWYEIVSKIQAGEDLVKARKK